MSQRKCKKTGKKFFSNRATARVVVTDKSINPRGFTPEAYMVLDIERGVLEVADLRPGREQPGKAPQQRPPGQPPLDGARTADGWQLQSVAVGARYGSAPPGGQEGGQLMIGPGGIELALLLRSPTGKEITEMQNGRVSIRLITAPNTLLLLAKFGAGGWGGAPYSVHRVPKDFRECPPDPGPGFGWLATFVMVDMPSGIVRAIRQTALSRSFSCALLRAFEERAGRPGDDAEHVREVERFQQKPIEVLAAEAIECFDQRDIAS